MFLTSQNVLLKRRKQVENKETKMRYVRPEEASRLLGVHAATLRRWAKDGKIKHMRAPGGMFLFDVDGFGATKERVTICYARVSSQGQKPQLQSQVATLSQSFPTAELVTEVGSGLSFARRKVLLSILERVMQGDVGTLVVCHKDRLSRFGFDLIEWICGRNNCKIVVLSDDVASPNEELVKDIVTILHVFSSRLYGLRRYRDAVKKDQDLPKSRSEAETQSDVRDEQEVVQQSS